MRDQLDVLFPADSSECSFHFLRGLHTDTAQVMLEFLCGRARVLFGGLGTADNATITLVAGPRTRRIVVNQRGRVRLQ